jgi:hypothetical protein
MARNLVHVQQRNSDEAMWHLSPSFVLSVQLFDSAACPIGQWQSTNIETKVWDVGSGAEAAGSKLDLQVCLSFFCS